MLFLGTLLSLALGLTGTCGPVVATTPIVADVVRAIADHVLPVVSLIPPDTDPHSLELSPQDLQLLISADVIFTNGAGLEKDLEQLLSLPEIGPKVVDLSAGLPLRTRGQEWDPHVWLDPTLVLSWAEKIVSALSELVPGSADFFAAQGEKYRTQLLALDGWIKEEVEKIPPERRLLVTDHFALGYFAARYGFREVGALVPSESSLAEPSALELAELVREMRALKVPAIFVSPTFNPALAERVAAETGAKVVTVYFGTLSGPDGPAPDYLSLMRALTTRIVEALKG
ncbi:MAG: metal ABC transporter substrate-binding protein [Candidatus Bipolaricaulaceae bacterium]